MDTPHDTSASSPAGTLTPALSVALSRYRAALLSARTAPVNDPLALSAAARRISRCWHGAVRRGATVEQIKSAAQGAWTVK